MMIVYPQTFYVVQDQNGSVMMKSYDKATCENWCRENGLEYKVQEKKQ